MQNAKCIMQNLPFNLYRDSIIILHSAFRILHFTRRNYAF